MRPPRLLVSSGLAVALVVGAFTVVPAGASSPPLPILTVGTTSSPANPGDSVGAQLTGSPPVLRLTTTPGGSVGLQCTQSYWAGKVLNDPVGPGPASIQFATPFQFQGCSYLGNPMVTAVNGAGMSGVPAPLLVSSATPYYPIQILPFSSPLQIVVSLVTVSGPVNCLFRTTSVINGSTTAGTNSWDFTSQPFGLVSGSPAACGVTGVGFLTASYGPVYDSTVGANLTVN